jgi:hypothetical protein
MRLPLCLMVALSSFFLNGCTTLTPKFNGPIFLIDQIPEMHCSEEIWKYGIYRRLSNGDKEYLPFCDPRIHSYLASHARDLELVEEKSSASK